MDREYEIPEERDDYEVVPLTPIRRLEKRISKIETSKSMSSLERLMDKIIDMVELNQRIVDEMIKANTSLREDLSVLVGKMDVLQEKISNFLEVVEEAGKSETEESDVIKSIKGMIEPLMNSIVETNEKLVSGNESIINNLSTIDKRLKRLSGEGQETARPGLTGMIGLPLRPPMQASPPASAPSSPPAIRRPLY